MVAIAGGSPVDPSRTTITGSDPVALTSEALDVGIAAPKIWKELVDCIRLGLRGEVPGPSYNETARHYAELVLADSAGLNLLIPPVSNTHPEMLKLGLTSKHRAVIVNPDPTKRSLSKVLGESSPDNAPAGDPRALVLNAAIQETITRQGLAFPSTLFVAEDIPVATFNPGLDSAAPAVFLYDPVQDAAHIASIFLYEKGIGSRDHQTLLKHGLGRLYRSQEIYSLVEDRKSTSHNALSRVVDTLRRLNIALSEAEWKVLAPPESSLATLGMRLRQIDPEAGVVVQERLASYEIFATEVAGYSSSDPVQAKTKYDDRNYWARAEAALVDASHLLECLGEVPRARELQVLRIKALTMVQVCDNDGISASELQRKKVLAYLAVDDLGPLLNALTHFLSGPFEDLKPSKDAGYPKKLRPVYRSTLMHQLPYLNELMQRQIETTLQRREQSSGGDAQQRYRGIREAVANRFATFARRFERYEQAKSVLADPFLPDAAGGGLYSNMQIPDPLCLVWTIARTDSQPLFLISGRIAEGSLRLEPTLYANPVDVPEALEMEVRQRFRDIARTLKFDPIILAQPVAVPKFEF